MSVGMAVMLCIMSSCQILPDPESLIKTSTFERWKGGKAKPTETSQIRQVDGLTMVDVPQKVPLLHLHHTGDQHSSNAPYSLYLYLLCPSKF